ncbi:hypothetical protein BJY04DRAFT_181623 [Aspergillus karnatakaensis]|uniref:F-box domain protein n=1 Tax=Aspergillus karnatakaensis TaxID=1810916 RepID=UPI003CCD701E
MASIELLPNELLDEIISFLSSTPPSLTRLHQPPVESITKSRTRDLKNLSLTCSHLRNLVRSRLFAHGRCELDLANEYLSFVSESDLSRCVTSVVVTLNHPFARELGFGPLWWRDFLSSLGPLRLTLVAPPLAFGELLGLNIPQEHLWAFEISHQVLNLEFDWQNYTPADLAASEPSCLIECLPWTSMLYNESSSLKAYNHYEYFLYQVPSIFHRVSVMAYERTKYPALRHLTSFTYVAVFPFYNHVQLALHALESMTSLQYLKIQLGPSQNDRATEIEQRGSMDPSDPWMELATAYSLIAHAVRNLGRKACLSKFTACDHEVEAVRAEIDVILGDILCEGPWTHDGHGTWTRKSTEPDNGDTPPVATPAIENGF